MAITDRNKSTFERLQELKQLYESGILTKEEMEAEKADILGQEKPHEEKPEQPQVSEEQACGEPGNASDCVEDFEQKIGNNQKRNRLIAVAVVLIVAIVLVSQLPSPDDGSTSNTVAADTTYTRMATAVPVATTEHYSGMQAVLEKVVADNPTVTDFFANPEISETVQNEYGAEFYNLLLSKIAPSKDVHINLDKSEGDYDEGTTYSAYFYLKGEDNSSVAFSYNVDDGSATVTLTLDGREVNPDGTFALAEDSNWDLDYEQDEFGDPIESKAYVYVEGKTNYISSNLRIAVMKGNENQVIFFHKLPWSSVYDNHTIESIKIKDKNKGSVYELKDVRYSSSRCILSEEDSRYIRKLCDSSPSVSFSIRFDLMDYELFMDTKHSHTIFNFDNGRAYGLSNALNHYFHRAF